MKPEDAMPKTQTEQLIMKIVPILEKDEYDGMPIYRGYVGGDRYIFDFTICAPELGWTQYDTSQDAWYFGVWIHKKEFIVVTFAEGDLSVLFCGTAENFKRELEKMNEFYDPTPAFVTVGIDGKVTEFYQDREELVADIK